MLLQCEIEDSDASEGAGAASWLRANTTESLLELNESCLTLLAEQARTSPGSTLLGQSCEQWRAVDAAARRRAAGCLYLLVDAGFADARRWQRAPAPDTTGVASHRTPFFTVPGAAALTQAVLVFAWHLARCQSAAARLLLGMPAPCVLLIAQRTLGQITSLGESHPEWLRPRWVTQPCVWRELLVAVRGDDAAALWGARLRGQTLLAAEARLAAAERPRRDPVFAQRPLMPTPRLEGQPGSPPG